VTYLELVNRVKQETGVAGSDITTVVGLTKEMKRIADWTASAWEDIQNERQDFEFHRKFFTFNTVVGQQVYEAGSGLDINLSDFATWRNHSFRIYRTVDGTNNEIDLTQWLNYSDFRDYFLFGTLRSVTQRPKDITIDPSDKLVLGFTPDDVYTVVGEYYRSPQILSVDADVPIIPSEFHMIIVYETMISYGYHNAASEQILRGKEKLAKLKNRLIQRYTPSITVG